MWVVLDIAIARSSGGHDAHVGVGTPFVLCCGVLMFDV